MPDAAPTIIAPMDQYNQQLVDNVHPAEWTNPTPAAKYNLVVIGAGTAGLVTAIAAAGLGAKVALIERHLMGGDCLNVGCVPSKAIINSSRVAAAVRDAHQAGVRIAGDVTVDFPAVMERMRRLRASISSVDSAQRFQDAGVDVFLGQGTFTGSRTVEVDGKTLHFKNAAITTGARAAGLPIDGLEAAGYLTNESVFSLTERPNRLAVIGAGPIGCEMAQTFQRLGSQVYVIEMTDQILGREDRDAAEILERVLVQDGVDLRLGSRTQRVTANNGEKVIHLERNGASEAIHVDEILVGVGRAPNVEGLGLDAAGVEYDEKRGIAVDDFLRTSASHIYAAGDCCMQWKFTHAADAAARILIQNALFSVGPFGRKKLSSITMPWCTYTHPEVAHIGMYEDEAHERGIETETFVQDLAEVDRAIVEEETEGFVKVVVQKGSDKILGGTIVARNAGDLIGELSVAMSGGMGLGSLAKAIHPYPTQADAIRKLGDQYNRTRLTPGVKKWFARWLALRRR